jgi:hypothetical protein
MKKTNIGRNKMLEDLGFEVGRGGGEWYMLPGKNTPIVTDF